MKDRITTAAIKTVAIALLIAVIGGFAIGAAYTVVWVWETLGLVILFIILFVLLFISVLITQWKQ